MDDQYNRAKEYVFRLLTYRPRTKSEIRERLKGKNYPEHIINTVISMLEQYNYINDKEFANFWIQNRCQVKPMGRWRLRQELAIKGIEKSLIEQLVEASIDDEKEYKLAYALIKNKRKFEGASKQKIYNFLARRGFTNETINRIIAEQTKENLENPYK